MVVARKYVLALLCIFCVASAFIKISILLFYRRLSSRVVSTAFRWTTWLTIGFITTYTIALTLAPILGCDPISAFWDQTNINKILKGYKYRCFDEGADVFTASVISAFQDLITAIAYTFSTKGCALWNLCSWVWSGCARCPACLLQLAYLLRNIRCHLVHMGPIPCHHVRAARWMLLRKCTYTQSLFQSVLLREAHLESQEVEWITREKQWPVHWKHQGQVPQIFIKPGGEGCYHIHQEQKWLC
jgi:hypothetical protein